MKKIFLIAAIAALAGCQKPTPEPLPEPEPTPTPSPEPEPEVLNVEGVWRDGGFFISFDESGYYSAHLGEEHLDTGSYTIEDKTITCKNNYNGKETVYTVKEVTESSLECTAYYAPYNAEAVTEERAFLKSEETPASKEHILVDKSWGFLSSNYGNITIEFKSHYIATKSSSKDSRFVNEWYYTYIEPYIYVQSFTPNDGKQHPTNSFSWGNDTGEVIRKKVSLREGRIIGVVDE